MTGITEADLRLKEALDAGWAPKPIHGGFRVKETPTHYIDVLEQLVNWRLVTVPKDSRACDRGWDRGWCYFGRGVMTMTTAVIAALVWDCSAESTPEGWNKDLQTGEYRWPHLEGTYVG